MMKPANVFRAVLGIGLAQAAMGQDQVVFSNPSGNPNQLYVWGLFSDGSKHKKFLNEPGGTVTIENVKPLVVNEIVSLTLGMRPAYKKHLWSHGGDKVTLEYPGILSLKTRVWVLCADDPCGTHASLPGAFQDALVGKLAYANTLFANQNAGLQLHLADAGLIQNATTNTAKKTPSNMDFTSACGGLSSNMKDEDALNLYVVRSVDGQPNRGRTCPGFPNVAVVGYLGGGGLMAHELGHNFALDHSVNYPELSSMGLGNIMHQNSSTRCCLSEGEVFRIHFMTKSFLNNNARNDGSNPPARRNEARSCHPTDLAKPCLGIGERIWMDP
jgi:hypothetical protein